MSLTVQPVSPVYADIFDWKSTKTLTSNVVGAAGNVIAEQLRLDSDKCFCLMAFLGVTNYDAVAGDFIAIIGAGPAAARTLVSPPTIPNNFEVTIKYNGDYDMMGAPMPQGCLCSNGYYGALQLVYPMMFPPMSTFDFEFTNTAPTLLKQADKTTAIDLRIDFGLYGYTIPLENLEQFLAAWPSYSKFARQGVAGWLRNFTSIKFPGLT